MTGAVYLDHNATSPVRPAVSTAVSGALSLVGNASSVHGFGRAARRVVEDARDRIAALVGSRPDQVVFTSGGTEANNLALRGTAPSRILVSAVEHHSVLEAVPDLEMIPVDRDGIVDLAALESMLAIGGTPALVSVMLANNETGVIQPVAEVARTARRLGAMVHCDAVQAAGKLPVRLGDLGVHALTLSAHKMGGPQGTGALVVGEGVSLAPIVQGGGQERGRRAGTETVALIAGFGAAAEVAGRDVGESERLLHLRDDLERRLAGAAPAARVFGTGAPRLPNTTCVTMPGVASETQVMALDLAGVAVSAGSACSSGKVTTSHVLRAMGVDEAEAATAIRVSLGWTSTEADVVRFVEAWSDVYERMDDPRWEASTGTVALEEFANP